MLREIPSIKVSEPYGRTLLYRSMIEVARELDCSKVHICLRKHDKLEDKAKCTNIATKDTKENRIGMSPTI